MAILKDPVGPLARNKWQEYCTQALLKCIPSPGSAATSNWAKVREELDSLAKKYVSNPRERRIIIADATLTDKDLRGFDFRHCYIVRTSFERADIRDCCFQYAIFRDSTLHMARAEGADFSYADIAATNLMDLKYNEKTKLNLARWQPAEAISPQLDDRIRADRRIASQREASIITRFLNSLTGFGLGLGRMALVCVFVILLFGAIYRALDPRTFAIGAGTLPSTSLTFWNFLLLSLERFFNASPWIYGISPVTHFLTSLETIFGLLGLGILVAMVVRQVIREK
jgi:Pentapeptide repeats (9 copies)